MAHRIGERFISSLIYSFGCIVPLNTGEESWRNSAYLLISNVHVGDHRLKESRLWILWKHSRREGGQHGSFAAASVAHDHKLLVEVGRHLRR